MDIEDSLKQVKETCKKELRKIYHNGSKCQMCPFYERYDERCVFNTIPMYWDMNDIHNACMNFYKEGVVDETVADEILVMGCKYNEVYG